MTCDEDPREIVKRFKTDASLAQLDHCYYVTDFLDSDPCRLYGPYPRYMAYVSNEPFDDKGVPTHEGQVYAVVEIAWPDMVKNRANLRELIANKIKAAILCVQDKVQHDG